MDQRQNLEWNTPKTASASRRQDRGREAGGTFFFRRNQGKIDKKYRPNRSPPALSDLFFFLPHFLSALSRSFAFEVQNSCNFRETRVTFFTELDQTSRRSR